MSTPKFGRVNRSGNKHRIKERVALDMTQAEFAKAVRCSKSTIESIELGRLPPSDAMSLRISLLSGEAALPIIERKVAEYRAKLMKAAGL